ncbi:MAG: outer membrane beta-barrel protein [Gemmatimonadaceae bacterium]
MMRKWRSPLLVVSFGLFGATLEAQMETPIRFGVGAGATIPSVNVDGVDILKTGYHFMGMVGFTPASIPVGLRGELMYHSNDAKDFNGTAKVLGGGLNAMWSFPLSGDNPVRPYLTGGVGFYKVEFEDSDDGSTVDETKFGLNGGGGLMFDLAGFGAFIEARYISIFTEFNANDGLGGTDKVKTNLIPITFGILLGGR